VIKLKNTAELVQECPTGFAWLILPFIINKHYAKHLLTNGFESASDEDRKALVSMGLIAQSSENKNAA
jgi:hypothetical protein